MNGYIQLHMQAYANMGFALDEENKIKREYNYYIEYFQCTGNFEEAFEKFKNAIKLYSPEIYNSYLTSFETIKNINI